MSEDILLINSQDGVSTLTLNRVAQHNAMDANLVTAIDQALSQLTHDAATRVLKITANGPYFCAGGDLTWFKNRSAHSGDTKILAQMLRRLYEFPKPTVAVAQGSAFGGGVGLLACCDIVIADKASTFCLSEVKLGLVPATISPYIYQALGMRQAKFLALTAERISADTAKSIGLVHAVASTDELMPTQQYYVDLLLRNGPEAMRICKNLFHYLGALPEDYEPRTSLTLEQVRSSPEAQEGISAFMEKRSANWQGSRE